MLEPVKRPDVAAGLPLFVLPSPLRFLHYHDALSLRAEHLESEQHALRALFAFGGVGGGLRIVHGLNVDASGADALILGAGLAVDARGRPLLLPRAQRVDLARLLSSTTTAPKSVGAASAGLYVLTAAHADGVRGTGADAARVQGVLLRARPLQLKAPLPVCRSAPLGATHLRSRVASAVFAGERPRGTLSASGLAQDTWCSGAAAPPEQDVPLAVFGWTAGRLTFVDPWIVRRERSDATPGRWWSALLGHRSCEAFLAEVLQFQCQLAESLREAPQRPAEPTHDLRDVLHEAVGYARKLRSLHAAARDKKGPRLPGGATGIVHLQGQLAQTQLVLAAKPDASTLLQRGIVELPPAGYLPVRAGKDVPSVNEQVRRLTGNALDLRFCVVRPDVISHALEEARHLERISLVAGLDDGRRKPPVDVLVPDGRRLERPNPSGWFEASLSVGAGRLTGAFRGAARRETVGADGAAFRMGAFGEARGVELLILVLLAAVSGQPAGPEPAGAESDVLDPTLAQAFIARALALAGHEDARTRPDERALWLTVRAERAATSLQVLESTSLSGRMVVGGAEGDTMAGVELTMAGELTVTDRHEADDGVELTASLSFVLSLALIVPSDDVSHELARSRRQTMAFRLRARGDTRAGSIALDVVQRPGRTGEPTVKVRYAWQASGVEQLTVDVPQAFAVFERELPPLVTLTLTPNAAVRQPENPFRALAESGLNVVARALRGEPRFKDAALSALFPSPPAPETLIEATRDWVFFHRRRKSRCAPARKPVVQVPVRYRLFELTADDEAELARALEQLESRDARRHAALRKRLDTTPLPLIASFDGTTLREDSHELRRAWQSARPGRRVLQAIAVTARGDGSPVQQMRLRRLVEALTGRSLPADVILRVLPDVPPALAQLEAEGSVLLVTGVEQSCQSVYGVTAEEWPELRRRLEDPATSKDTLAAALESNAVALGRVDFYADSTRVIDGDVAVADFFAKAYPGGAPVAAWTWTSPYTTEDDRRLEARRAAGLARLLGADVTPRLLSPRSELPTECDAVTVMVVG